MTVAAWISLVSSAFVVGSVVFAAGKLSGKFDDLRESFTKHVEECSKRHDKSEERTKSLELFQARHEANGAAVHP